MMYLGIDPGLTGAIAALHDGGKVIGVWDTPVVAVKKAGRRELDRGAMAALVREILHSRDELGEPIAAVELVHSMPAQGVASSFTFGMGYGVWLGILSTLHVPVNLISPQRWKRAMIGRVGAGKDASRVLAVELFGAMVDLSLKKHHGRADALLIAEYRRRIG